MNLWVRPDQSTNFHLQHAAISAAEGVLGILTPLTPVCVSVKLPHLLSVVVGVAVSVNVFAAKLSTEMVYLDAPIGIFTSLVGRVAPAKVLFDA